MPRRRPEVKYPTGIAQTGGGPGRRTAGSRHGPISRNLHAVGFGTETPGYTSRAVSILRLATLTHAVLLLLASAAQPARGESSLSLSAPGLFGEITADTYDEQGRRVGDSNMRVERLADGNILMEVLSGIDGSAQFQASAELAPNGADGTMRLVRERTQAFGQDGSPMGLTIIDHVAGVAQCGRPEGSDLEPEWIELPLDDRVVNVPLNLLFQPLARGDVEVVDFQVLLCRAGARIVKAQAKVAAANGEQGNRIVEVRYSLDFGPILSRLAAPFMPQLSFWFDEGSPGDWVGHRMPLFSKGPTVLVVRTGFSPQLLDALR